MKPMIPTSVPRPTLQRLPAYLQLLKRYQNEGIVNISCNTIATDMNLNPVLVRKDLAAVSSTGGRPKIGYQLESLILDVEHYLGYSDTRKAIVVGLGHMGGALFSYPGFPAYGMEIIAGFDSDASKWGTAENGKQIFPMEDLGPFCHANGIEIGVLTVPAAFAQEVCDAMVASGIRAIWNFAPVHLRASSEILIQNEDMAIPLAMLSKHLEQRC